jgi:hypothetical protein
VVARALGRYFTVVHTWRVLSAVMAAVLAAVAGEHHLHMTCFAASARWFRHGRSQPDGRRPGPRIRHPVIVRWGVDWRTVALGLAALVLAVGLGAWAGTEVGAWAGVLAALAGLLPPAVLAVAVGRRQRNMARVRKQKAILHRYAPPKRTDDREGQE